MHSLLAAPGIQVKEHNDAEQSSVIRHEIAMQAINVFTVLFHFVILQDPENRRGFSFLEGDSMYARVLNPGSRCP